MQRTLFHHNEIEFTEEKAKLAESKNEPNSKQIKKEDTPQLKNYILPTELYEKLQKQFPTPRNSNPTPVKIEIEPATPKKLQKEHNEEVIVTPIIRRSPRDKKSSQIDSKEESSKKSTTKKKNKKYSNKFREKIIIMQKHNRKEEKINIS